MMQTTVLGRADRFYPVSTRPVEVPVEESVEVALAWAAARRGAKPIELVDGVRCHRPTLGMTTTVQIDLEPGAERAFVGCLSGSVAEIAVARDASTETIVGVIDAATANDDDGSSALLVRRFDEERGRPIGERFVVSLADIERVTVF